MIAAEAPEREWAAEDVDAVCDLLVERWGVKGAKRRAFDVAAKLKHRYPEDSE